MGPISLAPKYILPGPLARFLGPSVAYTCAGELASRGVTRVLVLGLRVLSEGCNRIAECLASLHATAVMSGLLMNGSGYIRCSLIISPSNKPPTPPQNRIVQI